MVQAVGEWRLRARQALTKFRCRPARKQEAETRGKPS
jgi:hypothetical protein